MIALLAILSGCSTLTERTQENASETEGQARERANTAQTAQQALQHGAVIIPGTLYSPNLNGTSSHIIDDGVLTDAEGNVQKVTLNGQDMVAQIRSVSVVQTNLSRDFFTGMSAKDIQFGVNAPYRSPAFTAKNERYGGAQRGAVFFSASELNAGTAGTMSAESIRETGAARTSEKEAAGKAARSLIEVEREGKRQLYGETVNILNAAGEKAIGILELLSPIAGSTKAILKVIDKRTGDAQFIAAEPEGVLAE
jgi:hypothetical protein